MTPEQTLAILQHLDNLTRAHCLLGAVNERRIVALQQSMDRTAEAFGYRLEISDSSTWVPIVKPDPAPNQGVRFDHERQDWVPIAAPATAPPSLNA